MRHFRKKFGRRKKEKTFGDERIAVIVPLPNPLPMKHIHRMNRELKPSLPDYLLLTLLLFLTHQKTCEALLHSNTAALYPLTMLDEETNKQEMKVEGEMETRRAVKFTSSFTNVL